MDVASAVVDLVFDKLKVSATAAWLRFLFELIFSAIASFLTVAGSTLSTYAAASILKGTPFHGAAVWALSIGLGMSATAISLVSLFRRENSKLTRGMLAILPSNEAAAELEANLQTIQKAK